MKTICRANFSVSFLELISLVRMALVSSQLGGFKINGEKFKSTPENELNNPCQVAKNRTIYRQIVIHQRKKRNLHPFFG